MTAPEVKWYWPKNIVKSTVLRNEENKIDVSKLNQDELDNHEHVDEEREESGGDEGEQRYVDELIPRIESNSKVDIEKVYQDRLDEFLHPKSTVDVKEDDESEEEDNEDKDELELDLNSRQNKLKRRYEINKNENETEALSECEHDEDKEEENEENEEVRKQKPKTLNSLTSQTKTYRINII